MKTQNATNTLLIRFICTACLALFGFALGGCGVEDGSFYGEGAKAFGGKKNNDASGSKGGGVGEGEASPNESVEEGSIDEPEENDPNSLVLHQLLKSKFDDPSAKRLVEGSAPTSDLDMAADRVATKLANQSPNDGVELKQKYGDGVSRSSGEQLIANNVGDVSAKEDNKPSASGKQNYSRVVDPALCPKGFVCIERMTFLPKENGSLATYCYYESNGTTTKVFPYAVAPNLKLDDFNGAFKTYGPYVVKRFAGDVNCATPGKAAEVTENVSITLSKGNTTNVPRLIQKGAGTPSIDYEIIMDNKRVSGDDKKPYIDETVRLQTRTRYFINTSLATTVKMIRTTRSSVYLSAFEDFFFDMDGLQVDIHFELCKNFLANPVTIYCPL